MAGRGEDDMMAYLRRRIGEAERSAIVELAFHPNRTDAYNRSPDFIVDMVVTVPLFATSRPLRVKVPLLVEVEAAAGFRGGLEDLDRFVSRTNAGRIPSGPPIELPFPIATEANAGMRRGVIYNLPVLFSASEIPMPEGGPGLELRE